MKLRTLTLGLLAVLLIAPAGFAANSLAVTGAAALHGTNFGLAVSSDMSSNDVYVASTHPNDESTYNFSFYIYPGTFPVEDANVVDGFVIGYIKSSSGGIDPDTKWFIPIFLRRQNEYWTIQTNIRQDDDSFPTWHNAVKICGKASTVIPCTSFTNGVKFEFRFKAASAPGANDGTYEVYKNGTIREQWTGLDTDLRDVTEARFGAIFQGNAANRPYTNGTYYFDEFSSWR